MRSLRGNHRGMDLIPRGSFRFTGIEVVTGNAMRNPLREPPTTPLRDCSPEIQSLFGYASSKRGAAVTRDGHLVCQCGTGPAGVLAGSLGTPRSPPQSRGYRRL
jgi:hypothetical protein